VTNFFDTLGIGSFAPTMAWLKFRRLVPDRLIPCTMLVGHTPPAMAQGFIFLILLGVFVDPVLLVGCAIALLMGGLMGAPLVGKVRLWVVQLVVAIALLLAGTLYAVSNLGMMPGGGTATSLSERLPVTRQAVAKHLVVLDRVGLVHATAIGREKQFRVDPEQLARAVAQLADVGAAWDARLHRIRRIAEQIQRLADENGQQSTGKKQ